MMNDNKDEQRGPASPRPESRGRRRSRTMNRPTPQADGSASADRRGTPAALGWGATILAASNLMARAQNAPGAVTTNALAPPASLVQSTNAAGTNSPMNLGTVVVTVNLDAAREQIAPSLGAVTY